MRARNGITIVIAAAFLCSAAGAGFGAAAAKSPGLQRRNGADRMSQRGTANTNAQWSADPERGWVRAEERHRLHDKDARSNKTDSFQQRGKQKLPKRNDHK